MQERDLLDYPIDFSFKYSLNWKPKLAQVLNSRNVTCHEGPDGYICSSGVFIYMNVKSCHLRFNKHEVVIHLFKIVPAQL